MSEIKRVALNTLEPPKVSEKVIKKPFKTVRISVILPESNEDNCPEYNYKDQLAAVKKKVKQIKDTNTNGVENGLDPFGENDDDVRRIALEMEAKYGSGVTEVSKKKRKGKKDDYADIGMGYDESDSFIDNTDGYDEIIPQNVTTLHGGFYVNCGALVFKTDDEASSEAASSSSSSSSESSSSESEGEEKTKPKNRKRVLESSDDSDTDTQKEKKAKLQVPPNSMQHAIKKKLFSKDKIKVKKFDAVDPLKKTVKDLLREKREDLNMSMPNELKVVEDNVEKESSKENKKPMNISSVTDAIESVLKQVVDEPKYDKNQNKQSPIDTVTVTSIATKPDSPESLSTDNDVKTGFRKPGKEEEVKLPENLPEDIATLISKLKEAAMNYKGEGKKAFFTNDVNKLLLSFEKKSKILLNKSSRVKVYEHLSKYINCTKDTLLRRAKLLELEDGEKRLTILQSRLKDFINAIMPTLKAAYEEESEKILQKKFSKESINNEELKSLKMPRRKFLWNEESKKLIKDILGVKKRCLILEGKHKDNLEEQMTHFLRTCVLPLWPEGWMYLNTLAKVYNSMQESLRSSTSSPKLNESAISIKTKKHSNLSITPVANGKSTSEKNDVTNSITVTKVTSENETKNNILVKNNENNVHSSKPTSEKLMPIEKPSDLSTQIKKTDVFNPSDLSTQIKKTDVFNPSDLSTQIKKTDVFKPSDLSTQIKKTDVFNPSDLSTQIKKTDVFKPYISEPSISSSVPKVLTDIETQKQTKSNEMFKPYADDSKSIPDKTKASNYDKYLPQQYSEKVKPADDNKSIPDKTKASNYDKYLPQQYSEKFKPADDNKSIPDKTKAFNYDKYLSQKYSEKVKPADDNKSIPDKTKASNYDKYLPHQYSEKVKNYSHSDKSKHTYHNSHSDKDKYKHSGKEKHSYHTDKHSSHTDKHSSHTDKHSSHTDNKHSSYADKHSSFTDKHSSLTEKHVSYADKHSSHTDKHSSMTDKHSSLTDKQGSHHSEKDKHRVHSEKPKHSPDKKPEENPVQKPSSHLETTPNLDPSKSSDLSRFQMFKPYSETSKSYDDPSKYSKKPRTYSQADFTTSRYDVVSTKQHSTLKDSGVIVKNLQQMNEKTVKDEKKDLTPVISTAAHCQGVNFTDKRKILESFKRTPTELNSNSFFPLAVNKHSEFSLSTPILNTKSDGDGQKDIQMVMENLKALQKLSCSPIKNNDNSSSSPVSVIAYNKNFSPPKTSSSQTSRNDVNSRGDLSGGFQDEFQKQFINSLQQMAAGSSSNKSGYKNGS